MIDGRATKVFISHSKAETALAMKLKVALEQQGLTAWSYEEDLGFGRAIQEEIRNSISNCDHFLVILSSSAQTSVWVGRELGLALELKQKTGGRPSIIGVSDTSDPRLSTKPVPKSIWPRRFSDGTRLGKRHDFGTVRYFDFSVDAIRVLANQLSMSTSFIESPDEEQRELLAASFKCYQQLFPIGYERDTPGDIFVWLEESRAAESSGSPWREVYAVLHTGGNVVGMAFLSAHVTRHWCFGNYFGVLPGWRQDGRAEDFLQALKGKVAEIDPACRGILFEVEPVDPEALDRAANTERLRFVEADAEIRDNLRRLRRLFLYTRHGAVALVDGDGTPIPYWQPAMDESLSAEREVPLFLMALLWQHNFPLSDVLDFIYDDHYGDAYGGAGVVDIPGYREYTKGIKSRVSRAAETNWRFAAPKLPPSWRDLLLKARSEQLDGWLAL